MKNKHIFLIIIVAIVMVVGTFFITKIFILGKGGNKVDTVFGSDNCEWENRYQGLYGSSSVYRDIKAGTVLKAGGFVAPLGISYKEVEFNELAVIASTTANDSAFSLNGVDCGLLRRDTFFLNEFSSTCLNALKEGFNSFNNTEKDVVIHEIYIGMRYKPANCLT